MDINKLFSIKIITLFLLFRASLSYSNKFSNVSILKTMK